MVHVRRFVDLAGKFGFGLPRGAAASAMSTHGGEHPKEAVHTYAATFTNSRGKKIFCKYWEPLQTARALVYIAHGFAEHCLPYDPLARTFAAQNFFVFSHDHVGHGQSGGSRVHVDSFQHYVDDALQHIDMMKKKFQDLPVFLCGHSMGGAISILTGLQRPQDFRGVVLIGPCVETNPELTTPFKITIARMLRRLLPHFPVGALDYTVCCSCPNNVKGMMDDPLRWHGYVKAGFGACLIEATQEIQAKIPLIAFPFLLLQGEDDMLCKSSGAKMMFEKAASKDKFLKIYPKAYHCLQLEPNGVAEELTEDILQWITARA